MLNWRLIIFIPTIMLAILLFSQHWLPIHDSLACLQWVQIFYSQIAAGNLNFWAPYIDWGKPLNLWVLNVLTPSNFLIAPLALFFRNANATTFYYLGSLLDELVLVLGTFFLSKLLFKNKYTIIFVTFSLAATSSWFLQPHWSFRLYYAIPFLLFFILKFFQKKELNYLLIFILIAFVSSIYGNGMYIGFFQLFFCFVFFILEFYYYKPLLITFLPRKKYHFILILLISFLIGLTLRYLLGPNLLTILSPGRDSSGKILYSTYLYYGQGPENFMLYKGFLTGINNYYDAVVFGGVFIPPFMIIGIIFHNSYKKITFIISGVLIILLGFAGDSFVAPILFLVPGFNVVRHLAYTTPIVTLVFVILAGYGFEVIINKFKENNINRNNIAKILLEYMFLYLIFILYYKFLEKPRGVLLVFIIIATEVFLLCILYNFKLVKNKIPIIFLILIFIDVLSFRSTLFHHSFHIGDKLVWNSLKLKNISYIPKRSQKHYSSKSFKHYISAFKNASLIGGFNNHTEQIMGIEPCYSKFRVDNSLPIVAKVYKEYKLEANMPIPVELKKTIGCDYPKIQFFADTSLVIPINVEYKVLSFGYNYLKLEIKNSDVITTDYWLYYADAYHPFWKAFVNGRKEDIKLAKGVFKAVKIPSEKNVVVVEFIYSSMTDKISLIGIWVIITGLFLSLLFWSFANLKSK